MTIKTLTYIHNLLIRDVEDKADIKNTYLKLYQEEKDAGAATWRETEQQYQKLFEIYIKAKRALEEFEDQDWH